MRQLFRNRNIANSFWNLLDIFLYPLLFFGSTSFFIKELGPDQFGIWMLINTIVISMQVFNFGLGSGVFKNVAARRALKDEAGVEQMLNNSLSLNALLFGICLLVAAVLAFLVRYYGLLHIDTGFRKLCAQGILLSGVIVGFKFFEQIFTGYFKGQEQFKIAAGLATGNKIVALLVNIVLLFCLRVNVLQLLGSIIVVQCLFFLFSLFLVYRDRPGYRFSFNPRLPKQDASFALFFWFQSLAIIITFQADRYLIVNYFGLAVLTYYALTATIFNHFHMALSAALPWLSPKLTRLAVLKKDTSPLYLAARNLLAVFSVLSVLGLYVVYPFFFKLVLGENTALAVGQYVPLFLVFELFFALGIVPGFYFNALGHEKRYFLYTLLFAVATLILMGAGIYLFQKPAGVLYGIIASCIAGSWVQLLLIHKIKYQAFKAGDALLALLPSAGAAAFILLTNVPAKTVCLFLTLVFLYFINIKGNKNNFRLLFHS